MKCSDWRLPKQADARCSQMNWLARIALALALALDVLVWLQMNWLARVEYEMVAGQLVLAAAKPSHLTCPPLAEP